MLELFLIVNSDPLRSGVNNHDIRNHHLGAHYLERLSLTAEPVRLNKVKVNAAKINLKLTFNKKTNKQPFHQLIFTSL